MNEMQRARLALWTAAQSDAALWTAAQSDADLCAVVEENNDLRAELAATSLREREAERAVTELLALVNGTPRGVMWALWQMIIGRTGR